MFMWKMPTERPIKANTAKTSDITHLDIRLKNSLNGKIYIDQPLLPTWWS